MTKRELSKMMMDFKKETAKKLSARTRAYKKAEFEKAKAKEKVETFGDLNGIFCGLSKRAVEMAAFHRIQALAALGYSPAMIVKLMEPERKAVLKRRMERTPENEKRPL